MNQKPTAPETPRPAQSHTPGPWKQNDHPARHNQLYIRLGSGAANAIVERQNMFGPVTDEDIANARLIASAPALLAALRKANELGVAFAKNGGWSEGEWAEHQQITRAALRDAQQPDQQATPDEDKTEPPQGGANQ